MTVARGRRLASPSNWHYCSPRWLPMAEPGVRAGASSKLLTLRRAGGRESTSRPLGGCAAESVRPRKARKEFRQARTPVPKKISTMSRLTHARLPSPATLDQLCLWTLESSPTHTCLGMPLFSVRDGTQGKVSTVIRSRAPLGSLLPPLGPCRFLVPNY